MNSQRLHAAGQLIGRWLIAFLFLHEGYAKLTNYAPSVRYAEAFGVPGWSLPGAILVEIGCGLLLVTGLQTRAAAAILFVFTLATAVIFHTKFTDINQLLHFEKNLAIAGGLLILALSPSSKAAA